MPASAKGQQSFTWQSKTRQYCPLPSTWCVSLTQRRDFNPLPPPFPRGLALLLAREVTISWSFPSTAHPSLSVGTSQGPNSGHCVNWEQAVPSQLLFPAFGYEQLLQQHCCCSSPQLVSLCLGCSSGVLNCCPQLMPSTGLTSTAVMWGFICTNPGDRYRYRDM